MIKEILTICILFFVAGLFYGIQVYFPSVCFAAVGLVFAKYLFLDRVDVTIF